MKLYRWLGYAAVITAVITAVILLASHASGNRPKAAERATTVRHSPSRKPKAKPSKTTTTARVKTAPHRRKPTIKPLIAGRIKAFLREYYLIKPGDTNEVRLRRIAPFASKELLSHLKFGSNRSRTSTSVAQVLTDEMDVQQVNGNPRIRSVSVAILLSANRGVSPNVKYIKINTSSTWRYIDGEWIAVGFN
jgi:hypothetical protein